MSRVEPYVRQTRASRHLAYGLTVPGWQWPVAELYGLPRSGWPSSRSDVRRPRSATTSGAHRSRVSERIAPQKRLSQVELMLPLCNVRMSDVSLNVPSPWEGDPGEWHCIPTTWAPERSRARRLVVSLYRYATLHCVCVSGARAFQAPCCQ